MFRRLNLRLRLLMLVGAALLPLAALSVWSALSASRAAVTQAQDNLRLAASLVAAQQDGLAASAQHLLAAITAVPEIRAVDPGRCQGYLEQLRGRYPIYANIGLMDLRGDIVCHAAGSLGRFNGADRDYFREAIAQRRFVMGQMIVGRAVRRTVLPFALPVIEAGKVQAVAFVTLDVTQMQAGLNRMALPQGVRLLLVDSSARVLLETDAGGLSPRPPGTTMRSTAVRAAASAMVAGHVQDIGRDERLRVFTYVPTQPVGERRLLAIATIDHDSLVTAAWERTYRELALLAVVLVAGLGAAWWVGRRMIAGPAHQLALVAQRLDGGDLSARVELTSASRLDEFGQIAEALNRMAASLQLRQRQIEGELRNSQHAYALLDSVLNRMREGVLAATAQWQILLRNDACRALFTPNEDLTPDQRARFYGMHRGDGSELLTYDELPLVRAFRGESGQLLMFMRNERVPEGRLLHCSYQPLPAQGGVAAGMMVFADITDLKRGEAENARLVRELSELNQGLEQRIAERTAALTLTNRELEAFSYSVSHDLRSPLAAVAGFGRALSDRLAGHEDPKVQHYLARIQAGAHLMEQLIEGLLQLARLVNQPLAQAPVDLTALANDTLEWLRLQDPDREVRLEVQDGLATQGDPRLLRTVMQNLLGNAWKFTAGSQPARIEVGRDDHARGGQVFFVRDNGVGFDMAHATRLFMPFQRLHTANEFPGTGIGLATVQRVILRHQGRIWAEAAPGKGCTVYFSIGDTPVPEGEGERERQA